ncbi:DUF3290 domain-containing protein [Propionibacterium freudenreichii]|uniref:DUF3290 domain-containing protein n=1 Tax=Propionibacterium freudenreichii TaxID=1744 RepID=UPI0005A5CD8F|nr:DUF3290 domain-containing protein [Propionibacterium freudenreichii]CEI33120.1 Hypothetical membrane protein [Propionibacterium freudenreichii]
MNMWTYSYFQANSTNAGLYWRLVVIGAILAALVVLLVLYRHRRSDMRVREMLIIVSLVAALAMAMQATDFFESQASLDNSGKMMSFIDNVAQAQYSTTGDIAVSQTNLSTGLIIKVGDKSFYEVTFNNDKNIGSYQLTRTQLMNSQIEYVK